MMLQYRCKPNRIGYIDDCDTLNTLAAVRVHNPGWQFAEELLNLADNDVACGAELAAFFGGRWP